MRPLALVMALGACGRFGFGVHGGDDGGAHDGGDDDAAGDGAGAIDASLGDAFVMVDSPPGAACFGTFVRICVATAPTMSMSPSGILNTDTSPMCATLVGGSSLDACAIVGTDVSVNGALRAVGTRPLVLVSSTGVSMSAAGILDVAAGGANSNPGICGAVGLGSGQGGGPGGSYQGVGGHGGRGIIAQANANPALPLTTLHGGCIGGNGSQGPSGGPAGGAVALVAVSINVNGRINASGGGGPGGAIAQGGGGGGSGGLIVFDASTIFIGTNAVILAQGGGGGAGGGTVQSGEMGSSPTTPGNAAPGGTSTDGGSDGGKGGVNAVGGDGIDSVSFGAGGGGGGAGYIHATQPATVNGQVSPPLI